MVVWVSSAMSLLDCMLQRSAYLGSDMVRLVNMTRLRIELGSTDLKPIFSRYISVQLLYILRSQFHGERSTRHRRVPPTVSGGTIRHSAFTEGGHFT